jgi:hypothetical protein
MKKLLVTGIFFVVSVFILNSCAEKMPERWDFLAIPKSGLKKVHEQSDNNGLFVDYKRDISHVELLNGIDSALINSGYKLTCNELDGFVRGYASKEENLIVKIDLLDCIALSIFNEKAGDALIYGVCFKGYKLMPSEQLE